MLTTQAPAVAAGRAQPPGGVVAIAFGVPALWSQLNSSFHDGLSAAAGNPLLTGVLLPLQSRARLYVANAARYVSKHMARANVEHRAILEAYLAGDAETAAAVPAAHVKSTVMVDGADGASPDPADPPRP